MCGNANILLYEELNVSFCIYKNNYSYRTINIANKGGFLSGTLDDWMQALRYLLKAGVLYRKTIGGIGPICDNDWYLLEAQARRFFKVIKAGVC